MFQFHVSWPCCYFIFVILLPCCHVSRYEKFMLHSYVALPPFISNEVRNKQNMRMFHMYVSGKMTWWDKWCTCLWDEMQLVEAKHRGCYTCCWYHGVGGPAWGECLLPRDHPSLHCRPFPLCSGDQPRGDEPRLCTCLWRCWAGWDGEGGDSPCAEPGGQAERRGSPFVEVVSGISLINIYL